MNGTLSSIADMPDSAESPRWPRVFPVLVTLAVLALGVLVSLVLWREARERSSNAAAARFEYRTERIRGELDRRLDGYEATLRSLAGLIAARPTFERTAWRRYFEQAQPA